MNIPSLGDTGSFQLAGNKETRPTQQQLLNERSGRRQAFQAGLTVHIHVKYLMRSQKGIPPRFARSSHASGLLVLSQRLLLASAILCLIELGALFIF